MGLKTFLENIEDAPEALRDHYTQADGGYVLNVDNADYRQKLGEFRGNNINLMKERDDLSKKLESFKGIDPEKYRKLQEEHEKLAEKGLLEEGKVDELVEKRVGKMKADYDGKTQQLTASLDEAQKQAQLYKSKLDQLAINDTIAKAVSNVGKLQKGALDDVLSRAHRDWSVNENGVPVAMQGETIVYGKDGKLPLTAEEWAQTLMLDAPYLFEGNSGGGAGGSGSNSPGGVRTITRAEYQSGDYIEDVAAGKVRVID